MYTEQVESASTRMKRIIQMSEKVDVLAGLQKFRFAIQSMLLNKSRT